MTLKELYGDFEQALLLDEIFKWGKDGDEGNKEWSIIPWFSPSGERNIAQSPHNPPLQEQVVLRLMKSFERKGMHLGVTS